MATKAKPKTKRRVIKTPLTPEQKRNSDIFRLRGFYANAKTLPFTPDELKWILQPIDAALRRLKAETQTVYMAKKLGGLAKPLLAERDRNY